MAIDVAPAPVAKAAKPRRKPGVGPVGGLLWTHRGAKVTGPVGPE